MGARRRPGVDDRLDAIRTALHGIAGHADPLVVAPALAAFHLKNNTFPGEVLLALPADALDEAGASRNHSVSYEGLLERYLPEIEFRGRVEHHKSHYALQAAAMIHGGVEPDLLGEVAWWRSDDLWLWSLYALIVFLRVAAERTATPIHAVCEALAARHGLEITPDT